MLTQGLSLHENKLISKMQGWVGDQKWACKEVSVKIQQWEEGRGKKNKWNSLYRPQPICFRLQVGTK